MMIQNDKITLTGWETALYVYVSSVLIYFVYKDTNQTYSKFVKLWSTTTALKSYLWWNISKAFAKFCKTE